MKLKFLLLILTFALLFSACNPEAGVSNSVDESVDDSSITVDTESDGVSEEAEDEDGELSKDESSAEENSKEEPSAPEVSFPEYHPEAPDVSDLPEESVEPDDVLEDECRISIKYVSFSEKPYAVVVGTCDIGATVTLEFENTRYTSESWYGWFSVRFLCNGSSASIRISQDIDGKNVGKTLSTTVFPKNPGSSEGVVAGGNFQFFYQKCLKDYRHTNTYSAGVLANLKNRISSRISNLEKTNNDTEIIYMIVPSAMTVYPELVPEQYQQGTGESRLDQVVRTLSEAGATVIDLRETFEQHKNDEYPLYFKCDSHWTDYGAFIAYQELFNHISKKFPDAAPLSFEDFAWHGGYYKTGDMPVYLNMITGSIYESKNITERDILEYGWYRTFADGTNVSEKITDVPRYRADTQMVYSTEVTWAHTIRTNRDNLPSCIVMRDSFGTQMFDIVAERMDKTIYKGMWDSAYYGAEIVTQKLDYYIYIFAEWNLDSIVYN